MAMKNITDLQVLKAYVNMKLDHTFRMLDLLMLQTGECEAVCWRCMERVELRGYVGVGVSLNSAWLTDEGKAFLAKEGITDLTQKLPLEFTSFDHFRNTMWVHRTGEAYVLMHVANTRFNRPGFAPTAVYKDNEERVYARPIGDFLDVCKPVGALVDNVKGKTGYFLPATANHYKHAKVQPKD